MAEKKKITARIQLKNDTSANWDKATNFRPTEGEPIVVNDNKKKIKLGDGETLAKDLPYLLDIIPVEEGEGEGSVQLANGLSTATGEGAIALGKGSKATGLRAFAESMAEATGNISHAEGNSTASGQYAHAEGFSTSATSGSAHSEGERTSASGLASHAEGYLTEATNKGAHAEGQETKAEGQGAHTEGTKTLATMNNGHAEGNRTKALHYNAHAEGQDTIANANSAHAEGEKTQAHTRGSHSEGIRTSAGTLSEMNEDETYKVDNRNLYEGAHAEGYETKASNIASHAEGKLTIAEGYASHAGGFSRHEEKGSNEWGNETTWPAGEIRASGEGAFAHGYIYPGYATGGASHNPGHIIASGKGAFALGCAGNYWGTGITEASGDGSFAMGKNTKAQGNYSVALGEESRAFETGAFAAGVSSDAFTKGSVAMGYYADAEEEGSIALGTMVTATAPYQVVMGYANDTNDNAAFIIGDGENFGGNIFEVIRPVEEVDYSALITYGNIESLLILPCEEFDGGDGNTYNQIVFNSDHFYFTGGPLDEFGSPTLQSENIISEDGTTIIEPYASHLPTEIQHLVRTKKTPVSIKIGNVTLTDTQLSQLLTLLPKTFTFYIDDNQYEAEEDMTWLEWIYSPYNIDGYVSQNSNYSDYTDYIWNSDASDGAYVRTQGGNIRAHHSDVIIANYPYVLSKVE